MRLGSKRIFLIRALTAVMLAELLHLAFVEALLGPLIAGPPSLELRIASAAVVVLTCVVALVVASIATIRRGPVRAARATPPVLGLLPPLASLALIPVLLVQQQEPVDIMIQELVPLLATSTAVGLVLALALERSLASFAVAGPWITEQPRAADPPPALAAKLARLIAGLGLGSTLLVVAHVLVAEHAGPSLSEPRSLAAFGGLAVALVLALFAAATTGSSPGRDVLALAERLDAFAWDDTPPRARPLASEVRITSFDAVGQLFRSLEQLRARLAEDAAKYQLALDRTREADNAKAEFLAAVSHELRTPLNSILGFAQLLLEGDLNEAQAEDVRLILAGGRQLLELLEDVLDISLIESGELELRLRPTDLGALIHELVDIHRGQAHDRTLELRAEVPAPQGPDALPQISCDRRRVGQVLTNLLSNAIKFTERGSVRVVARHDRVRQQVSIEVHDTGVGIAPDELSSVFEEYRQVGSRKRKLRGTGLGLAIARRIAEAHGGSLGVRSELGVGSVFTLRLPETPPEQPREFVTGEEIIAALREAGLGGAWAGEHADPNAQTRADFPLAGGEEERG